MCKLFSLETVNIFFKTINFSRYCFSKATTHLILKGIKTFLQNFLSYHSYSKSLLLFYYWTCLATHKGIHTYTYVHTYIHTKQILGSLVIILVEILFFLSFFKIHLDLRTTSRLLNLTNVNFFLLVFLKRASTSSIYKIFIPCEVWNKKIYPRLSESYNSQCRYIQTNLII